MQRIIKTLLLSILITNAFAQHLELGLNVGLTNYFGDIAPTPVLSESNFCYGAFARVNLSSSLAINLSASKGTITGDDKNSATTKIRNINFITSITEYALWFEYNFFNYGVDVLDKRHTPYVFAGIALTQFDPATRYQGQTIKLRNLRLEDISYNRNTTSIPFGIGYKWQFHKHFAMDWALGFRRSGSDFLDDVSTTYPDYQDVLRRKGVLAAELSDPSRSVNGGVPIGSKGYRRGNPDYTDWYIFSTISLSYRFYKNVRCRRFY